MADIAELGLSVRSDGVVVATNRLRGMEAQAGRTERVAGMLTGAMTRLATVAGTAVVAAVGTQAVRAFASYEQGLRNVGAVSGATAAQLDALDNAALRAASSTRFNPSQTTQALYSLASAGQSAEEQISSLPNVLNLAEAAQGDLGQTTELLVSTLSQYNLAATESGRVADVFTASIGASALNVNRLQVAFRNAGPTASALNQTLEGTTAALGILTTAFGNGERAGTGLRAVLNELPKNAEDLGINLYDASGAMRPFVDLLADMEANGLSGAEAVRMFGAEAGPALAALLTEGSDGLRTMEGRLTSTGQAAEVAGKQLDTLQGDLDNLKSAIDVAMVEIGRSQQSFVRPAVQTVTNLIRLWSGYGDELGDARESTEMLAGAISNVGKTVLGLAGIYATQYVASIGLATAATGALSGALKVLRLAIAGTGVGALALILTDVVFRMYDAATQTEEFGEAIEGVIEPATRLFNFLKNGAEGLSATFDMVSSSIAAGFMGAFATIYEGYANLVNLIRDGLDQIPGMETSGERLDPQWASGVYQTLREDAIASGRDAARAWRRAFSGVEGPGFSTHVERGYGDPGGASDDSPLSTPPGGGGGSITDEMQRQIDAYDKLTQSAEQRIASARLEATTLGMTAEAANRMRIEQEFLNQAANDNIDLTAAQRGELSGLASSIAAAEEATRRLTDIYNFGKQVTRSFFETFRSGLSEGKNLWESFGNAAIGVLDRLGQKAMEMAADGIFDMIFGSVSSGFGGGGGGLFGNLFGGLFGGGGGYTPGFGAYGAFAMGGYTGDGGVNEPAGIVHRGEYVLNASATRNIGRQNLDAMNAGRAPANGNSAPQFSISIGQINANSEEEGAAAARGFTKELRRILPDEIERYNRNPYRRAG